MIVISDGCSRVTYVVHISDENLATRVLAVTNVSFQPSLIRSFDIVLVLDHARLQDQL